MVCFTENNQENLLALTWRQVVYFQRQLPNKTVSYLNISKGMPSIVVSGWNWKRTVWWCHDSRSSSWYLWQTWFSFFNNCQVPSNNILNNNLNNFDNLWLSSGFASCACLITGFSGCTSSLTFSEDKHAWIYTTLASAVLWLASSSSSPKDRKNKLRKGAKWHCKLHARLM